MLAANPVAADSSSDAADAASIRVAGVDAVAATRVGSRARRARGRPASSSRRSASATSIGRCATTTTELRRPSSRIASAITRSVSSSRCAVGSSSRTHGRSASTTRARASRARSPADRVVPSSPSGSSMPQAQLVDPLLERHLVAAPPTASASVAPRARRAAGCRRWCPRRTAAAGAARRPATATTCPPTGDPWDGHGAVRGGHEPGERREQGGLAAPGRAGHRRDAACRDPCVDRSPSAGTVRPG